MNASKSINVIMKILMTYKKDLQKNISKFGKLAEEYKTEFSITNDAILKKFISNVPAEKILENLTNNSLKSYLKTKEKKGISQFKKDKLIELILEELEITPEKRVEAEIVKLPKFTVLQLFSKEELVDFFDVSIQEKLKQIKNRPLFLTDVKKEVSIMEFLSNKKIQGSLNEKIWRLMSFISSILMQSSKKDLIILEKKLGGRIIKENDKKDEMTKKLLGHYSLDELISNHIFRGIETRPSVRTIKDSQDLKEIMSHINDLNQKNVTISSRIGELNSKIENLSTFLRNNENRLVFPRLNAQDFLRGFYERLKTVRDYKPENVDAITVAVKKNLQLDDTAFLLKGLEFLVSDYVIQKTKEMQWEIEPVEFFKILKNEFTQFQVLGNLAEIPKLRDFLCKKLGIKEMLFDKLLIDSWKNGWIELEAGSPIGESNVKYLVTDDGVKFYYVKLKR